MKVIEIKSQNDIDSYKESDESTELRIFAKNIILRKKYENSSVVARENSSVVALGNSSVVARENSSVVARENSSVVALENSSVVARENSSVVAWENSSVVAWGNSFCRIFTSNGKIVAHNKAIVVFQDAKKQFDSHADVIAIKTTKHVHSKDDFLGIYTDRGPNGGVILYKTVKDDMTDYYTGKIKYSGLVECPDWDDDQDRQCGGGLHLSPTKQQALLYNKGKVLKCEVMPEDFVVYGRDITKVRCKRVRVLDAMGKWE